MALRPLLILVVPGLVVAGVVVAVTVQELLGYTGTPVRDLLVVKEQLELFGDQAVHSLQPSLLISLL